MEKYHQKPITHIGQVSINVTDLQKALEFYQKIIGFHILNRTKTTARLTADGIRPLLYLEEPSQVKPKAKKTTGLYHFALLLPTRADLSSFLQHLLKHQIPFGVSDHAVSEAIYLNDPDGNGIEVYRDRSDKKWQRDGQNIYMTTKRLDSQQLLKESKEQWNYLPKKTIIGHIHLHVAHLEETEYFYHQGLNLDVVTRYPGALFMSSGGYHHHLGLNIWNGEGAPRPEKNSVGLNWFSLVIDHEQIREQYVKQVKNIGAPVRKNNGDYMIEDPSGHQICLVL